MAEAAVQLPNLRFFCHKCSQEINPVLPEYTCPRCESGFIEELTQHPESPSNEYAEEFLNPTGASFDFLQLLTNQNEPRSQDDSIQPFQVQGNFTRRMQLPLAGGFRRNTSSDRAGGGGGINSLDGLLQQILGNLTGGAGLGNTASIPIFFNLHGSPGDYAWGRGGLDAIITQLLNQLDCTGPPPLDVKKIEQIPTVRITKEQVDKTLQCTVCMEDYRVGETVRKLPCQHHFHNDCIVPWLELHCTCPICRKSLSEDLDGSLSNSGPNSTDQEFSTGSERSSSSSSSAPHSSTNYNDIDEYD